MIRRSLSLQLVVEVHWRTKGEPREHPNESNQLEFGFLISQTRGDSNNPVFERDCNSLDDKKLDGFAFGEILVKGVVCGRVNESRDEK
jgi:hypothetical protein